MATTAELKSTRDALYSGSMYLLESVMRAQAAGIANPAFPAATVVNLAQAMFRGVVELEVLMGGATPPSLPASPNSGQPSTGGTISQFDVNKFMEQITAKINAQTAENMKKALDELQKKVEQTQPAPPPDPQPPVQG